MISERCVLWADYDHRSVNNFTLPNDLRIINRPLLIAAKAMNLNWLKHATGWYSFFDVDLSSSHFDNLVGVYIIWHGGTNPAVVRVGQGIIRDRLTSHRNDSAIAAYKPYGMYVTWAAVPAHSLDGVERHLAETWSPKVGDRFPAVSPIRVLSPFA